MFQICRAPVKLGLPSFNRVGLPDDVKKAHGAKEYDDNGSTRVSMSLSLPAGISPESRLRHPKLAHSSHCAILCPAVKSSMVSLSLTRAYFPSFTRTSAALGLELYCELMAKP